MPQAPPATRSRDRIVWLDLELYSLDDPRVLECAVILTTCNALTEVARRDWVLSLTQEEVDTHLLGGSAAGFHEQNSMENGLIAACLQSTTTHQQWRTELEEFLQEYCEPRCRLAGFSPHCDRDVLRTQAPNIYQYLSHQIIDISSLDIIQWGLPELGHAARCSGYFHGNHRAMSDNEAAIAKLKWYQEWLRNNCSKDKPAPPSIFDDLF